MKAAQGGDVGLVEWLVEGGANVNAVDYVSGGTVEVSMSHYKIEHMPKT